MDLTNVSGPLLFNVGIDCFSLAAILIIYLSSRDTGTNSTSEKLFHRTQSVLLILIVTDGVMWLINGVPGPAARAVGYADNIVYFFCQLYATTLWLQYTWYRVYRRELTRRQKLLLLYPALAFLGVCDVLSPLTGWIFYLDAANVYHRGVLAPVSSALALGYIVAASVIALGKLRRSVLRADRDEYLTIASFLVAPLIGGVVQTLFYGCSLIWPCTAFSALLVCINSKNQEISLDALTGLNNRRSLDKYLHQHCGDGTREKAALIMLDLNSFKAINDCLGHAAGDGALVRLSDVMKAAFHSRDAFLARFGGDEFVIILPGAGEAEAAEEIRRLRQRLEALNGTGELPYPLSVSAGCAAYPAPGIGSAEQLLLAADARMYEEKRNFYAGKR